MGVVLPPLRPTMRLRQWLRTAMGGGGATAAEAAPPKMQKTMNRGRPLRQLCQGQLRLLLLNKMKASLLLSLRKTSEARAARWTKMQLRLYYPRRLRLPLSQ